MKKFFSTKTLLCGTFVCGLAALMCGTPLATLSADDTTLLNLVYFQTAFANATKGSCEPKNCYGFLGNGYFLAKARAKEAGGQQIQYSDVEANALWAHKFNAHEGMTITAGYSTIKMDLSPNDNFTETQYPSGQLGFLAFTDRVCGWLWQTGLNAHLVWGNNRSLGPSSRYTYFLWGRYNAAPCTGFHIGAIALTGIRKTVAVPIFGFDYTVGQWKLNAIFPVNLGVTYNMTKAWSLTAMGMPFITRRRLQSTETLSSGIWEYRNYGVQLGLNYRWCTLYCSIFGGYSFGGTLQEYDSMGNNPTYTHFNGSGYAGLNLMFMF